MKKPSIKGLLAFGIAIVMASCGNSGSENTSSSGGAAPEQPKEADCGDIDDYIQKADKYIDDVTSGSLSATNAAEFIQEAESIANQIEDKGESAFSNECWARFTAAQQRLLDKANTASEKMMKDAGASMEEAEKMMKEMEAM